LFQFLLKDTSLGKWLGDHLVEHKIKAVSERKFTLPSKKN
jgi:hypothetical protein